jgi:hypothetical protein
MLVMSHAGGVGVSQTAPLNFVPQFLMFTVATAPSGVKQTVFGDGIITDLDAKGVLCLGRVRRNGVIANMYIIPCADGLIKNKTNELIITSAAAGAFNVYAGGEREGSNYIQCIRQYVNPNSPVPFRKFHFLGFPDATATDTFDITYRNGLSHKNLREELQYRITATQNDVVGYNVDNLDPDLDEAIDTVLFSTTTGQSVFVMRTTMGGAIQGGVLNG